MGNLIEFELSPWLILVCLIGGATYSYIQYSKDSPWSEQYNFLLATARGIIVSLIAILLLGPLIRAIKNYFEEPVLVIAIDNSESVALVHDSVSLLNLRAELAELGEDMDDAGWNVSFTDLEGSIISPDTLRFDAQRTDLTKMIRDQLSNYTGANLGALVTVSDGIFNAGFSPDLITPFTPIYTLGLGDTIPQKDISIIDVDYNKTVYQDNRFPILLKLRNEGINNETAGLSIYKSGTLIDTELLEFNSESRVIEQEFILEASEPGKHRISIVLDSVPGELTTANNRVQLFIDVIDAKQKILLAAEAPTPEMKAFRTAIGKNDNFEIDEAIGKVPESMNYDLVVLFNSPTRSGNTVFTALSSNDIPKLYFVGSSTDLRPYISQGMVRYSGATNQFDQVRASLNPDLKAFNLVNDLNEWLSNVPPMAVRFGDIIIPPNAQIILWQKVGSVTTNRPLMFVLDEDPKAGFIIGDGFWSWRLDEFWNYGETVRFDELVSKLTRFLAARPDNRQFKLYPAKDGFELGEELIFIAETYNQIFEPLYGEPVALTVFNDLDQWNYSFTPLSGSNKFGIDNLPEGLYSYRGTTYIDGKQHTVAGQFSVEKPNAEAADLTADHRTMRRLSEESGGKYYSLEEVDALKKEMASLEATSVIHSQETEIFLFNLPWVLILILSLITLEWLSRKMLGSY